MTVRTTDPADLRKRALLVGLTTKLPGVDKKHREASDELCEDKGVKAGAAKVIKEKFDRRNAVFADIVKSKGLLRNTFLGLTGPWQDDGLRIISARKYPQLRQLMDDMIADLNTKVEAFVAIWATIVAQAKHDLGPLYESEDYPTAEAIRAKFKFVIETQVIPDHTNTVLDLDAARIEKLTEEATSLERERLETLSAHTHTVTSEALGHMVSALREFGDEIEGTKRTRTFRDSLVKGMAQLADVLPGLNVTGDPKLDKLASDIAGKLTLADPATLRGCKVKGDKRSEAERDAEASKAREELADDAEDIFDSLSGVFGDGA